MKEVSPYKNNVAASTKKHILSILIDYFCTFILMYLIFLLVYPLCVSTGYGGQLQKELNDTSISMVNYVSSTHLRSADESYNLSDVNTDATNYVTSLVKTSSYIFDLAYPIKKDDGTYDMDHRVTLAETFINDALNYPLENIAYYVNKFKPTEASINTYVFDNVDYQNDKVTYQYLKVMQYEKITNYQNVFVKSTDSEYIPYKDLIPIYLGLNKELTTKFIQKIVFNETIDTDSENIFTSLKNCYLNGIDYGVNELENKCTPYIELNNQFKDIYSKLTILLALIMIGCYFISYILLVLILRLITKRWVTLGMRIYNLGFCDTNEMEPGINLLFYHIVSAILYFSSIALALYLSGLIGVLTTAIVGPINLLTIILFILTLDIISLIFIPFNKRKQSLSNLITRTQVKDLAEFEGPIEECIDGKN